MKATLTIPEVLSLLLFSTLVQRARKAGRPLSEAAYIELATNAWSTVQSKPSEWDEHTPESKDAVLDLVAGTAVFTFLRQESKTVAKETLMDEAVIAGRAFAALADSCRG